MITIDTTLEQNIYLAYLTQVMTMDKYSYMRDDPVALHKKAMAKTELHLYMMDKPPFPGDTARIVGKYEGPIVLFQDIHERHWIFHEGYWKKGGHFVAVSPDGRTLHVSESGFI